jgi:hypothetical protein
VGGLMAYRIALSAAETSIDQALTLLREAATIAGAAKIGMPRFTVSTGYGRNSSDRDLCPAYVLGHTRRTGETWEKEAGADAEIRKLITVGVDGAAWQYLMHESGLRSMMDATARAAWDKGLHDGEVPPLTAENIRSTFQALHASRGEMFERGVLACFKGLSWCYKTNLPQKFGKRIVLQNVGGTYSKACDRMDDLVRVFHVLDGKPEPDHRGGTWAVLSAAGVTYNNRTGLVETEFYSMRTFKNGNGHVTFKRADLVDKMNRIIGKHYPNALPAPR